MLSFLFHHQCLLSPIVFASLRRLAHLTKLELVNVKLNLATIELANSAPLFGIRSLMLHGISLEGEEKIALIIAVFNERLCHFEKPVDVILLSH